MKVVKFGGSSMADAGQYRKIRDILLADPERKVVVVSAAGKRSKQDHKITDLLYLCYAHTQYGVDCSGVFEMITSRYREIARDLDLSIDLEPEFAALKAKLDNKSVTQDELASRGEYFSARLMADYLGFKFVDAADWVHFRFDGTVDQESSYEALRNQVDGIGVVIPGFYGQLPDGKIKTFTRGGSDITGALAAAALDADVYENWTDVDGFLSADPRIVEHPKLMKSLTYTELRELAYMGANVLHPESIFPVRLAGIPINIKNTFNPDSPGTMIVPDDKADAQSAVVTGIAGKTGLVALNISKQMMNAEVGFSRKLLSVLEQCGISYEHLPSGVDSLSLVISGSEIGGKMEKVINRIRSAVNPDSISVQGELSLVAVVGKNMKNTRGTGAKALTALADAGISVRMIDQGASEINIILGVDTCDYKRAVNAVYQAFFK